MENLSKEFFDRIERLYPEAVAHFKKWLKQYKQHVRWDVLFNQNGDANVVTFYDIPYDMQNGIMARYDIECNMGVSGYISIKRSEPQRYTKLFIDIQDAIDEKRIKTK
jgi:hypothetical protein